MRFLVILAIVLTVANASACETEVPAHVLVSSTTAKEWPFPHSGCSEAQLSSLSSLFAGLRGSTPVTRLREVVGEGVNLRAAAETVNSVHAGQEIYARFPAARGANVRIDNPTGPWLESIPPGTETTFTCHPCRFETRETISVGLRSFGQTTSRTLEASIERTVRAYRTNAPLPAFSQVHAENLIAAEAPPSAFAGYFTDTSKLRFYKTNKTLRAGEFLRESDLIPLPLVRAGDRVDLLFENGAVRIKAQALSRQNGGLGDRVEVWNQANGKKYNGTVTDQNKVVVEL